MHGLFLCLRIVPLLIDDIGVLMLRALKIIVAIPGLWLLFSIISVINANAGAIASSLLLLVCIIALFRPLPQIGLARKGLTIVVLVFVAFPMIGGAMSMRQKQREASGAAVSTPSTMDQQSTYAQHREKLEQRSQQQVDANRTAKQKSVEEKQRKNQQTLNKVAKKQRADEALKRTTIDKKKVEATAKLDAQEQAAEKSEKSAHKTKLTAKTTRMTDSIVTMIHQYYKAQPKSSIANQHFCRDDGYCDFKAEQLRIQVFGAGIATIETTSQASRADYVEMCAVLFAAISGTNVKSAGETVGEAYGRAMGAGSFKQDINGVQIQISPDLSGTMECTFFKYGN